MKKRPGRAAGEPAQKPKEPKIAPLKPRPRLLLITGILMALWIVALIVMYFTTVWPHRPEAHPRPTSTTLRP